MTSNLKSRNEEANLTTIKKQYVPGSKQIDPVADYGLNLQLDRIGKQPSIVKNTSYQDENINETFRTDGITTPKIVVNNTDNQQKKKALKPNKNLTLNLDEESMDEDDKMGINISPAKSIGRNSLFSPNRANI